MRELLQECQRITTHYEWVAEVIDIHDDIVDCGAFDSLAQLQNWVDNTSPSEYESFSHFDWGLHRMSGSEVDGMQDGQYAYVKVGELPSHFDGGNIVPKRFHALLAKHLA